MQPSIILLVSALALVNGQYPTYHCPPIPPPAHPTYQCPSDTTTTSTESFTTSSPPTTSTPPSGHPTYQCPSDTTTTSSESSTTSYPTTTDCSVSTTPSCLNQPQCNLHGVAIDNSGFGFELTPVYVQIITPGGDHGDYDSLCTTVFSSGDGIYIMYNSVVYKNATSVRKRYFYGPIEGTSGTYRGEGINGNDACSTCVFNDYFLGQPCNGTWVLRRCYIHGACMDEYDPTTYVVVSTTPYISNECYGPIQDLIGTNCITLPKKYDLQCITQIGSLEAVNAASVAPEDRVTIDA